MSNLNSGEGGKITRNRRDASANFRGFPLVSLGFVFLQRIAQRAQPRKGPRVFVRHWLLPRFGMDHLAQFRIALAGIFRHFQRQRLDHDLRGVDPLTQRLCRIVLGHFDLLFVGEFEIMDEAAGNIGVDPRGHWLKRDDAGLHHGRAQFPVKLPVLFAERFDAARKAKFAQGREIEFLGDLRQRFRLRAQRERVWLRLGQVRDPKSGWRR